MMFRMTTIMALAILISLDLTGQKRPKYKDVLPEILKSESSNAVALLKSYMEEEAAENASQHLQLGLIYHNRFAESDPLRDFKGAMANIALSKEAFEKSKPFINEKDVNKRQEEFINFGELDDRGKLVIKYDSILSTMDQYGAIQTSFEEKMPPIYEAFSKSYLSYSKASNLFSDIVGEYRTIKDLYLLYDDKLAARFDDLKNNYQESLAHFEVYKGLVNSYPIGYTQELQIDSIKIYRLDGLNVEVNFLQETIPLWNYAAWVDEVNAYVANEIAALRKQMVVNEKLIASKLARTEEDFTNGTYEQLQVDKQFLFNLRKYDLRSVIEPLFKYKEYKHAMLHQEHWSKTIDADESDDYDRKMSSYGRMVHNIRQADTVLQQVIERDVKGSYEKYNEFIDVYYEGIEGIKTYANLELANNEKDFHHYIWKIQNIANQKYHPFSEERMIKYGKWTIPDHLVEDQANPEEDRVLYTTHIVQNLDESEYLGGVFFNKQEGKKSAFICKKEPNGRVSWFKEFLLEMDSAGADSHTELAVLYAAQTGCTFVLNGTHVQSGAKMNMILALNERGDRIMQHGLDVESYPRTISYVQATHSYMVTFKGEDRRHLFDDNSKLYVDNINNHGESVWERSIDMTGNVTGVVVVDDGYLISGNYKSIVGVDGKSVSSPNGEATFLIKLNIEGKFVNQLLLPKDKAYYTDIFFKTGDHAINLFGSFNEHGNDHIEKNPAERVHFIVTKDLHMVSDSFWEKSN